MSLFQKLKNAIAEQKEAYEEYKKAQKEEKQRVQHLEMQKKLETKKTRLAAARTSGIKSAHKVETLKQKIKEKKEELTPAAKRLLVQAGKYAVRELIGRPPRRPGRRKRRRSKR